MHVCKIKQGNPTIEGINGRLDYPFHKHLKVKVSLYLCFYCMQHIAKYNKRKLKQAGLPHIEKAFPSTVEWKSLLRYCFL
jgi:hypothetical protein